MAAAGANRAWIVGYNLSGPVGLYWNGTKWAQADYPLVGMPSQVSAGTDGTAYSVAGVGASGGGLSAIMRWNGSAWVDTTVPLPASSSITAVDVKSKSDVWLAGTTSDGTAVTGLVMHYDGTSWKRLDVPGAMGVPAYQGTLTKIVANSPTNVYVSRVRQNAQITNALLHWNGSSWTTVGTPLNAAGIGLSGDGQGGVVMLPVTTGTTTQYMHYSGSAWTTLSGPARSGAVQAGDLDWRPGTTGIVSAGTAARPGQEGALHRVLRVGRHPIKDDRPALAQGRASTAVPTSWPLPTAPRPGLRAGMKAATATAIPATAAQATKPVV